MNNIVDYLLIGNTRLHWAVNKNSSYKFSNTLVNDSFPRNINLSFTLKLLRINFLINEKDFKFEWIEPIAHILLDFFNSTKLLMLSKLLFIT